MCIHSVLQQQMTDEAVVTTETVTNYLHLAASGSSQIITASIPTFFYRLDALSADQTNCIKALNTNFFYTSQVTITSFVYNSKHT